MSACCGRDESGKASSVEHSVFLPARSDTTDPAAPRSSDGGGYLPPYTNLYCPAAGQFWPSMVSFLDNPSAPLK